MAININHVVLVGRLTKDVEVRKTNTGLSVAQFSVAVNRRGSKDAAQQADFINCVAWRQTADFLGMYAKKGMAVSVEGRLSTRNYDDQNGHKVYVTEVTADNVSLQSAGQNAGTQQGGYRQQTQQQAQYAAPQAPAPMQDYTPQYDASPELDISSDDLPF